MSVTESERRDYQTAGRNQGEKKKEEKKRIGKNIYIKFSYEASDGKAGPMVV